MQPAPIHMLLGPDEGKKQQHLKKILHAVEQREGQAPERSTFYAGEQGIGDAISLLRTGSLFNPHRVVLFHGAESLKSADDQTLLEQYSRAPSSEGTLILLSQETRVPKKIESCVPKKQIVICWELFENQKEQLVSRRLAEQGREIERDGLELLLESVEGTSDQLQMACDRLISLFPEGAVITEGDIDAFLFHSKQESVFTLFHAIGSRDLERSLEILHTLLVLQENKSFQIVAGIAWQLRRLLSIKERLQRGQSPAEVWDELRIRGKLNRERLLQAARNFSLPELQERARMTTEIDASLRSDRSGIHHHLMHLFVFRCVWGIH